MEKIRSLQKANTNLRQMNSRLREENQVFRSTEEILLSKMIFTFWKNNCVLVRAGGTAKEVTIYSHVDCEEDRADLGKRFCIVAGLCPTPTPRLQVAPLGMNSSLVFHSLLERFCGGALNLSF
ncbi:uncharacterized protein PHA67_002969 isoform 2-T2 [Liasis olivaceus]